MEYILYIKDWEQLVAFINQGIFPYVGLKFAFYEGFKNKYSKIKNKTKLTAVENLILGGIAGTCAVSITYPTDLIRRRRQIQILNDQLGSYKGLIENLYSKEGVKGFYRGLKTTYYKVIPSTALSFSVNEFLKSKILNK